MNIYKILFGLMLCLSTSACAYSPVEELIRPPKITEEQTEIHQALYEAIGSSNVIFKYPRGEEYRSAISIMDLDDDEQEEAIVFYKPDVGENSRLNILDNNGRWESVLDMPGYGDEVDFLSFSNISESEVANIIVGWENSYTNSKTLAIYILEDNQLRELATYPYDTMILFDKEGEGLNNIITIEYDRNSRIRMIGLNSYKDTVDILSEKQIKSNIFEIINIEVGNLDKDTKALFIDAQVSRGDTYQTEIFIIEGKEQESMFYEVDISEEEKNISSRDIPIISKDYDGDGIIDIPSMTYMPGYSSKDENPMYLTTFLNMNEGKLENKFSAAINLDDGYMVKYPKVWIDKVTVEHNSLTGEWSFISYEKDEYVEPKTYLRVRVYSKNDYRDKFESDRFTFRAEKGSLKYYTYIPKIDNKYSIKEDDLMEMFYLL